MKKVTVTEIRVSGAVLVLLLCFALFIFGTLGVISIIYRVPLDADLSPNGISVETGNSNPETGASANSRDEKEVGANADRVTGREPAAR